MRAALVAVTAVVLAVLPAGAASADAGPCVRIPGSIYWEVCANRGDCAVYVWSTMPPAICLER